MSDCCAPPATGPDLPPVSCQVSQQQQLFGPQRTCNTSKPEPARAKAQSAAANQARHQLHRVPGPLGPWFAVRMQHTLSGSCRYEKCKYVQRLQPQPPVVVPISRGPVNSSSLHEGEHPPGTVEAHRPCRWTTHVASGHDGCVWQLPASLLAPSGCDQSAGVRTAAACLAQLVLIAVQTPQPDASLNGWQYTPCTPTMAFAAHVQGWIGQVMAVVQTKGRACPCCVLSPQATNG